MGEIKKVLPVKLIAGVFGREEDLFETVKDKLAARYGPVDFTSRLFSFGHTSYYR